MRNILAFVLPGLLLASPSVATTVFSDTFNSESLMSSGLYTLNYTSFAEWSVVSGAVDITVLPNGFINSPGGYGVGQSADTVVVDLNGSTSAPGVMETTNAITFFGGNTYTLTYALGNARNQTNSVRIEIPGLVDDLRTQVGVTAFATYQTVFMPVTTTSVLMRITSLGGNDQDGLLLDNVTLSVQGTSGVTDPAYPSTSWARLALAPLSGPVRIDLDSPAGESHSVEVFDVRGRRMAALIPVPLDADSFTASWDGRDGSGARAPGGVYFAVVRAGARQATLRFAIAR